MLGDGICSARANSATVAKRSAGAGAMAFRMASSTCAGTVSRSTRTLGVGALRRLATIASKLSPDERRLAGQHLVEHRGERVEVGSAVYLFVVRLLRAHVEGRADLGSGAGETVVGAERAGDAEVAHQGRAIAGEEDVLGLHVAVHHALLVRVLQGAGGLGRDAERLFDRELALAVQPVVERLSIHERHREPELLHTRVRGAHDAGVEHGQDEGMLELGGELDLALEPFGTGSGGWVMKKELEGDRTIVAEVVCEVDDPHATASELAPDRVAVGERLGATVSGTSMPGLRGKS